MRKLKIAFVLAATLFACPLWAQPSSLAAGDSVSSTSSESKEITDKVRRQIEELNKGILHGDPQFSMVGSFQKVGEQYVINGDSFIIDKDTIIQGELKSDSYIEVRGYLVKGKPNLAKQITVANPGVNLPPAASRNLSAMDFKVNENR